MARPFLELAGARTVELTALLRAHLRFRRGARPARAGRFESAVGARGRARRLPRSARSCSTPPTRSIGSRPPPIRRVLGPADGGAAGALTRAETPAPPHLGPARGAPAACGSAAAGRPQRRHLARAGRSGTVAQRQHARGARAQPGRAPDRARGARLRRGGVRREVVLSRAEKDAQGNPTVPCRWLVRLRDRCSQAWASSGRRTRTGAPGRARSTTWPTARPEPRPAPDAARRGPAAGALGQRRRPVDEGPLRPLRQAHSRARPARGARGRSRRARARHHHPPGAGSASCGPIPASCPIDAERRLLDLGRELFEDFSHRPQVMALWWPRFERIAAWVIEQERARRAGAVEIKVEVKGVLELAGAGRRLPAQGARRSPGAPRRRPDHGDRLQDRAPARARRGGLRAARRSCRSRPRWSRPGPSKRSGAAAVAELLFWQLRGDETGGEERRAAALDPAELAAQALDGLSPADRALRPARRPPIGRGPSPRSPWRGRLRPSGAARRMDRVSPTQLARRLPPTAAQRRAADADLLDLGDRLGRHRQDPGARRPGAAPAARRQRSAPAAVPDLHQGGGGRDGGAGRRRTSAGSPPRPRRQLAAELADLLGRAATSRASGRARARCSPRSSTCPPACRS